MPLLTFLLLFLMLAGAQSRPDLRRAFLQAALGCGALLALASEALSLLGILNRPAVIGLWAGVFLALALLGWRRGLAARGWQALRTVRLAETRLEWVFFSGLALVALTLLAVALLSTPNNVDSMLYHLPRVAHWVQNASLRHFPTGYEHQLANPIWAELGILHLRLLGGGDASANLVQWFAMLGSLAAVSAAAGLLGASRAGQWAAAIFAAAIPMGLLQATSTQNDYANAFWLICLAHFVLRCVRQPAERADLVSLGLALGLGLLTKGTFYPYAVPFGVLFLLGCLVRLPARRALTAAVLVAGLAILLNLGYWGRNLQTYGTPLGPRDWIDRHTTTGGFTPGALIAAPLQNLLLNFATPSEGLNERIVSTANTLLPALWPAAKPLSLTWAWNYEDLAGHPLGVLLGLLAVATLLARRMVLPGRLALAYTGCVLAAFVLLTLLIAFDSYGARYQLPFWITLAPVFGCAAGLWRTRRPGLTAALLVGLLVFCLPYLAFNRTRPLIGLRTKSEPLALPCLPGLGCTSAGSILAEPPAALLFTNWSEIRPPYEQLAAAVQASGCQRVGLLLDSHEWEYPFWWLLDAPESGIHIEALHAPEHLAHYADPAFQPCAVICTLCGEAPPEGDLELALDTSFGRLYLEK